ncbi:MAG: type II secretion system protein [Ilumatobacter sp.]|uniref:type II secretion system protein n=1 Tax=Ilumatobacter sp. TaxID=1967498 RepID=UPI00262BB7AA|nr:type II secretion system protein [Ilumatobacter sp.]MDJ0771266.1 type II secretion system protein [Ilumatobacter sp.]
MRCSSERPDRGFTLIELIVVVTMLAIVAVALTGAVSVFLRTSDDLDEKLDASHTAQLMAAFLPPDIQSAATFEDTIPTPGCGTGSLVVELGWTDEATSFLYVANYSIVPDGADQQLIRTMCENGTIIATDVVGHRISSAVASAAGQTVRVDITTEPTDADPSGYSFAIAGTRRT